MNKRKQVTLEAYAIAVHGLGASLHKVIILSSHHMSKPSQSSLPCCTIQSLLLLNPHTNSTTNIIYQLFLWQPPKPSPPQSPAPPPSPQRNTTLQQCVFLCLQSSMFVLKRSPHTSHLNSLRLACCFKWLLKACLIL